MVVADLGVGGGRARWRGFMGWMSVIARITSVRLWHTIQGPAARDSTAKGKHGIGLPA